MPQETKSLPIAGPGVSPAGWAVDVHGEKAAFDVLEKAFDFRGDITLTLRSGRSVSGYLFDRKRGRGINDSYVRLMAAGSDDKVRIAYTEITHVAFSDRDPAAGKSFETWIRKYVEKKLAGEKASIESETLD